MSKFLLLISFILISTTQAKAKILSGCAMAHGNLAHTVALKDKKFEGRFYFPSYRDLEKDSRGEVRSVNAPLSNDGVFSSGLNFMKKKKDFLAKIFGKDFSLIVDFDACELQQSEDKELSARFCSKKGPFEINGVELKRLEFSLQNQVRRSLTGSEGQTALTDVTYADLIFTTQADSEGRVTVYRSSFSYFPNGDSIQCYWN